jgi:hypothetical protein
MEMKSSSILGIAIIMVLVFTGLVGIEIAVGYQNTVNLEAANCTILQCELVTHPEFGTHETLTLELIWNGTIYSNVVEVAVAPSSICPTIGTPIRCYFDETDIATSLGLHRMNMWRGAFLIILFLVTCLNGAVLITLGVTLCQALQKRSEYDEI